MATFTALNGSSPRPAEGINGTAESERVNGQSANADPRTTAGDAPANQREGWSGNSHDRLPFPGATRFSSEAEGSNKRKRSNSDSPRRERPPSPSERRERTERSERSERPEQHGSHQTRSESREGYVTPQRESYRGYGDDRRDERRDREQERERERERERDDRQDDKRDDDGEQWHSRDSRDERNSSYEGPYSAGPVSAQSDDQAGDRLRRATSQGDSVDYGEHSPDGDDRGYSGQYTPEQRRDGVIQSDPKKRKRNFSNRTKTGCLTCRRRKKKCDETKPECKFWHGWLPTFLRGCLHGLFLWSRRTRPRVCSGRKLITILQVTTVSGVALFAPVTRRRGEPGKNQRVSPPRLISSPRIPIMCRLGLTGCLNNNPIPLNNHHHHRRHP